MTPTPNSIDTADHVLAVYSALVEFNETSANQARRTSHGGRQ